MDNVKESSFLEKYPVINNVFVIIIFSLLCWIVWWALSSFIRVPGLFIHWLAGQLIFIDEQTKSWLIPFLIGLTPVIISVIWGKTREFNYTVKAALREKQIEPYNILIDMLYDQIKTNGKISQEALNKKMLEFNQTVTLWGSNRVIKKWTKFRRIAEKQSSINEEYPEDKHTKDLVSALDSVFLAIRKDMGHKNYIGFPNRLKKGDLFAMLINKSEEISSPTSE